MSAAVQQQLCQRNQIAAYIDGELETAEVQLLESHLAVCAECRKELRAHQLFISELDAALSKRDNLTVPSNFSRVVAARASSDMSGVRSSAEHRKAFIFIVVLASTAFGLLGSSASEFVLVVVQRGIAKVWAVIGFVWSASYDALASIVVIGRVMSRKFVVEPRRVVLSLIVLAGAIFLLSRLLSKYRRMGATD
ncbi:MAG: hypothetical protein C5B55_13170 [Blastocatellia bacterium]|nr:MAG: hypothetical protein C5B55_13170 [Blastocatellia bacterium]